MKLILSLLSVGFLVFSGCTGGGESGDGAGIKDVFIELLGSEPSDLHPIRASEVVSTQIRLQTIHYASAIVETLMRVDIDDYELKPNLAERLEVSEDGKTFTFFLRKDVKFHDGSMMTSEDVEFSFKALFDDKHEAFALRSFYNNFVSSKVIDEYTISFTAKNSYYLNSEVIGELRIFPKKTYSKVSKENTLAKTVVGSGPYKFDKWSKGKSITLIRYKDWWGNKTETGKNFYKFKKIMFKFVKESSLRIAMLERGKADYDNSIRAEDFTKKMDGEAWGKSVLKVKAENKLPKNMSFIGLNNKNIILKDRRVRLALAHLVNRKFIINKFYYDMSEPATGPFRLASEYANPDVKPIPFDTSKARAILAEAGWSDTDKDGVLDKIIDGQKRQLQFELLNTNKDTEKVITVIKEDMKKAGVNMRISTIDWNAFTKALNERKFEAVIMAWGGGGVNPDPTQIWHSKSIKGTGSNFVSYSNEKVDTLIDSAINMTDKTERLKAFHQIHKMIAEDAPYIFFLEPKFSLYAVSARVKRKKDTFNYSVGPQTWSLPE